IIRSETRAGKIIVTANAEGLKTAMAEIISRPVPASATVTEALTLAMPDEKLPSYLDRGPTPAGDAVTVTRRAVPIASATAGANNAKVTGSFDDNEVTTWSNDGEVATGWIRYQLARVATVSEVTLKLAGWRTRTYPITITVDDKVVFTGQTARSLGYVTISFPPATGKSLKIQLTGDTRDHSIGNVTEVGQKDAVANVERGPAKGTLDLVETEIYEPLEQGRSERGHRIRSRPANGQRKTAGGKNAIGGPSEGRRSMRNVSGPSR
ncbi:MAG TPA: hypothetical protein VGW36_00730, partial [Pyrinomonadaceae bacterium]|nr:hypothetical protein [Pyrinomonadaceae bacterium]